MWSQQHPSSLPGAAAAPFLVRGVAAAPFLMRRVAVASPFLVHGCVAQQVWRLSSPSFFPSLDAELAASFLARRGGNALVHGVAAPQRSPSSCIV
ncbi:hypothetical protein GUJ93_ZPchr0006g41753 [Zizania palustris]|uniref:Uncharacterized protein n=1 Tax=Zizania palustris TaxID=103762 RepID=A0A8J5SZP5_ZIZPA|nr:hypothetical protein GUJ93_ZPchr0006g41753 [Zizania palustris]